MVRAINETNINMGYNRSRSMRMLHSPEQRMRIFIASSYGKYPAHASAATKDEYFLLVKNNAKKNIANTRAKNGLLMSR